MIDKNFTVLFVSCLTIVVGLLLLVNINYSNNAYDEPMINNSVTINYYDEDSCEQTQQCELLCNSVYSDSVMFCDYYCLEKLYCEDGIVE